MALWLKIVVCILAAEALGGLGGFVTASSIDSWYADLEKPPGNPPNWVFGPVWTALYAMIGIAFALVWHRLSVSAAQDLSPEGGPTISPVEFKNALIWFTVQFGLNLIWTPVFFGTHRMLAALVIIVALLVAILITIPKFHRISPAAAWLLVPYALWVSYAIWLNAGYWWLNR